MKQKMADKTYQLLPEQGSFPNYATAVHSLQDTAANDYRKNGMIVHPVFVKDDNSLIFRPLTFKENLQAKVEDFETQKNPEGTKRSMGDRLRLFTTFLDSCTGTGYQKGTTKFKIIPLCKELITIAKNFSQPYIQKPYDQMEGIELDTSKGKYRELLTQAEVLKHPAWLAAVGGDKPLLKAYSNIAFKALKQEKAMGFWHRTEISEDQLRALYVNLLNSNSYPYDTNYLYNFARLLLAQPNSAEGASRKK